MHAASVSQPLVRLQINGYRLRRHVCVCVCAFVSYVKLAHRDPWDSRVLPGKGVAPELGQERAPVQEPNAVVGAPVELVEGDEK